MQPNLDDADLYEDVAQVYIYLVERDSWRAASVLRTIHATAGAHAAMRAAVILTVLKGEVRENHSLPNLNGYTYLLRDYPEAVAGFEKALAYCLPAWGMSNINLQNTGDSKKLLILQIIP